MTLKVSAIFSTHDRPDSLQRSIDAVLAQRLLPHELIIVHGGSKPVAPDIAEILRVAGERFRYHRQTASSLTISRNQGMAMAKGDILLLLDDDVILPPDYLQRLCRLYEADRRQLVAGIGGVLVRPGRKRLTVRAWDAFAAAFGLCRWGPRRNAARYVALPAELCGKLTPAWRLYGGAISLRQSVAEAETFEKNFAGYSFGEDLDFSFRVGRNHPLFLAKHLKVRHEASPLGRLEMRPLGRMYVANFLFILRNSTDARAGNYLLFAYDIAGTLTRYLLWATLSLRRKNLNFATGMIEELLVAARLGLRNILCAS